MNLEIHGFEDCPFSLLVFLLAKCLIRISLVAIEVGHVLIQLYSLSGNDECSASPKLLTWVQFLQNLEDIDAKRQGLLREKKLVTDGGE